MLFWKLGYSSVGKYIFTTGNSAKTVKIHLRAVSRQLLSISNTL